MPPPTTSRYKHLLNKAKIGMSRQKSHKWPSLNSSQNPKHHPKGIMPGAHYCPKIVLIVFRYLMDLNSATLKATWEKRKRKKANFWTKPGFFFLFWTLLAWMLFWAHVPPWVYNSSLSKFMIQSAHTKLHTAGPGTLAQWLNHHIAITRTQMGAGWCPTYSTSHPIPA